MFYDTKKHIGGSSEDRGALNTHLEQDAAARINRLVGGQEHHCGSRSTMFAGSCRCAKFWVR